MRTGPGTVAVITGASAGVGRAVAHALAARGCRLGLIARGRDGLAAAAAAVEAAGGTALPLAADVADATAVMAAAAEVEGRLGAIDLWINNAMVTVFAPVAQTSAEEYRRVIAVTYLGTVHGTLAALHHMSRRDRGTIVQVGSALAYRSIPLQSAYCAAKAAVRGFTDSLRCELLHDRSAIRLTMVQLPAVNTPQFDWNRNHMPRRPRPVGTIHQPEAIAAAIVDAAERAPREVWVGAPAVQAILGQAVAPGRLDRMMAHQAYEGQMSHQPRLERPDNLHRPLPGDWGAHGRFDGEAREHVGHLDQSTVLAGLAAAAVGMGLAAAGLGRWTARLAAR